MYSIRVTFGNSPGHINKGEIIIDSYWFTVVCFFWLSIILECAEKIILGVGNRIGFQNTGHGKTV